VNASHMKDSQPRKATSRSGGQECPPHTVQLLLQ
jgi:hypothetical protein